MKRPVVDPNSFREHSGHFLFTFVVGAGFRPWIPLVVSADVKCLTNPHHSEAVSQTALQRAYPALTLLNSSSPLCTVLTRTAPLAPASV